MVRRISSSLIVIILGLACVTKAHAGFGSGFYMRLYLNDRHLEVIETIKTGAPVLVLLEPQDCPEVNCIETVRKMRDVYETLRGKLGAVVKFATFDVPSSSVVQGYLRSKFGIGRFPAAVFFMDGKVVGRPFTEEDFRPAYRKITAAYISHGGTLPSANGGYGYYRREIGKEENNEKG